MPKFVFCSFFRFHFCYQSGNVLFCLILAFSLLVISIIYLVLFKIVLLRFVSFEIALLHFVLFCLVVLVLIIDLTHLFACLIQFFFSGALPRTPVQFRPHALALPLVTAIRLIYLKLYSANC